MAWRIRCLLRWSAVIALPRFSARFYLPARWGGQGTTMIYATRDQYEVELSQLDRFVNPGDVFVDAGANCGIFTVAAACVVGKKGRVLSFEPALEAGKILRRNIALNGLEHVTYIPAALSDRDGRSRLYHHGGPVAYSLADDQTGPCDDYEEIETITLDRCAADAGLSAINMIKMDVEGAEELVLRGGSGIIRSSRPHILFELNPIAARRFGLSTYGAWDWLKAEGYRFYVMDDNGRMVDLMTPPEEGQWEHRNIIAVHTDRNMF